MKQIICRLESGHILDSDDYRALLCCDDADSRYLKLSAVRTAQQRFGCGIFVRGLIEISSYCRNNCYYCGLRRDNTEAERYRLTENQILECCEVGYRAGLRTFVLQGGEDSYFSDEHIVPIIKKIAKLYPDAAITLSLGERSEESYRALYNAGARRYLLRHEAADYNLYKAIHPQQLSYHNRLNCIKALKDIGYQVGMGMMIGVPNQSIDHIIADLQLLRDLRPQMVGIGPFIPHSKTPFANFSAGSIELTERVIAIVRLLLPNALIPATTALSTLSTEGHRLGIEAGANVIMPNLSPIDVRSKYNIYNGKAISGAEAAEGLKALEAEVERFGYHIDYSKGDYNE